MVVAASDSRGVGANYRCDGTADEVEINAALALAGTFKGGRVLLLAGTYNTAAAIQITVPNIALSGEGFPFWGGYTTAGGTNPAQGQEGFGAKIKASGNYPLVQVTNASAGVDARPKGILMEGLYLYGYNYTGTGIQITGNQITGNQITGNQITGNQDQPIIRNCFVHHTSVGMDIAADSPHIAQNTIMDVASTGLLLGSVATKGLYGYVADNVIADIGGDGISLPSTNGSGTTVVNNLIVRCLNGVNNNSGAPIVTGNQIYFCREWGIAQGNNGSFSELLNNRVGNCTSGGITNSSSAAQINNNTVSGNTGDNISNTGNKAVINANVISGGDGRGIQNVSCSAVVISDNVIDSPALECINAGGSDQTLSNNIITAGQVTTNCVAVTGDGAIVTGNRVRNASGSVSASISGLFVSGGVTHGVVKDNMVSGFTNNVVVQGTLSPTLISSDNVAF